MTGSGNKDALRHDFRLYLVGVFVLDPQQLLYHYTAESICNNSFLYPIQG